MVSHRCKMMVKEKLNELNTPYLSIKLGKIELEDEISNNQLQYLTSTLLESGLEVMSDKRSVLIEKIKNTIIEMIYHNDALPKIKYSEYLIEKLKYDYTYLANLFSKTEGITIAHFILLHKVERIKEYIIYDELTLTEISYKMNYSSVAALSNQFKKITGLTPSLFKSLKDARREVIGEVKSNKKSLLVEKIKSTIIEMIHNDDELPKIKFSKNLSEKLQYDYTYLANLFSKTEGITIAHFILLHKIERIKEFIIYDELTLTEISYKMKYSSVAALSNQFKKITGLTPSFFKSLKDARREVIENL